MPPAPRTRVHGKKNNPSTSREATFDDLGVPFHHRYRGNLTADHLQQLKDAGIELRYGKFTDTENRQLWNNWMEFIDEHDISPDRTAEFALQARDMSEELRHFVDQHQLFTKMCRGLPNRSFRQVRSRCMGMFAKTDEKWATTKGLRWTQEEDNKFQKLVEKYDMNWKKIAEKLKKRTWYQCRNRYNYLVREKGLFGGVTTEETERIIDLVAEQLQVKNKSDLASVDASRIDWSKIAALTNRTTVFLSQHWVSAKCRQFFCERTRELMKKSTKERRDDTNRKRLKLVKIMRKLKFKYETTVDWEAVAVEWKKESTNEITGAKAASMLWSDVKRLFFGEKTRQISHTAYEGRKFKHILKELQTFIERKLSKKYDRIAKKRDCEERRNRLLPVFGAGITSWDGTPVKRRNTNTATSGYRCQECSGRTASMKQPHDCSEKGKAGAGDAVELAENNEVERTKKKKQSKQNEEVHDESTDRVCEESTISIGQIGDDEDDADYRRVQNNEFVKKDKKAKKKRHRNKENEKEVNDQPDSEVCEQSATSSAHVYDDCDSNIKNVDKYESAQKHKRRKHKKKKKRKEDNEEVHDPADDEVCEQAATSCTLIRDARETHKRKRTKKKREAEEKNIPYKQKTSFPAEIAFSQSTVSAVHPFLAVIAQEQQQNDDQEMAERKKRKKEKKKKRKHEEMDAATEARLGDTKTTSASTSQASVDHLNACESTPTRKKKKKRHRTEDSIINNELDPATTVVNSNLPESDTEQLQTSSAGNDETPKKRHKRKKQNSDEISSELVNGAGDTVTPTDEFVTEKKRKRKDADFVAPEKLVTTNSSIESNRKVNRTIKLETPREVKFDPELCDMFSWIRNS